MNSQPEQGRSAPRPADEPVAIVGIGALYPGAHSADAYWSLLNQPLNRAGSPYGGSLDDLDVDVARFGIPPAQSGAMARMQILMLEAARRCLADTGHDVRRLPGERTDVVVGTCFGLDRQYSNALRIEGSRYARDLRRALEARGESDAAERAAAEFLEELRRGLGASPHDRVGEMASTIPARIAAAFKFRGRTLALESADATSFVGLAHAVTSLRAGTADAALVVAGHRRESPLLERMIEGWVTAGAEGRAGRLTEGVGALLLKPLSLAERDGDRVYARILHCALRLDARPGPFRRSSAEGLHRATARAAYRGANVAPESVQYVERVGAGSPEDAAAELAALAREHGVQLLPGTAAVGSAQDRIGHTLANAGLAAVSKVALALHHRTVPPSSAPDRALPGPPAFRSPVTAEPWERPAPGLPRRAAVTGTSVTGAVCHLVMEEHTPTEPRPVAGARTRERRPGQAAHPAAEPIAIVGMGAKFAGSPDPEAFWQVVLSGQDRIAPVSERVLDRELYYAPGSLSLTHSYTELAAPIDVPGAPPSGLDIAPDRYRSLDGAQRTVLETAGQLLARRGEDAPPLGERGLVAVGSNLGLTRNRQAHTERSIGYLESVADALPALAELSDDVRESLLKEVRAEHHDGDGPPYPALLDGQLASGGPALVAHEYGLHAFPLAVEAACASSLAALDLAVGALRSGDVDYALAGGVELACTARDMVLCSALGLLSHDRITPFDAAADGFTPGDGCALFLLKRYEDARRDGDTVLGTIRAVGASNDAKSLIAPDAEGQARAIQRAFAQVEFAPDTVDYLEAHGTGTKVGDRAEVSAVAEVYSGGRDAPLLIGSAKSHFGHTYAAAGAAGTLRALLALRTATVPPGANLTTLNPDLPLDAIPALVPTQATDWPAVRGRPRRAAVSSFGTGGINYHLLLEEHRDGPR
ncbi:polyketide synthase [Streptomyces violascens]|uniref:polyketide synthase n=1 Tax=Streptomyces violascens TaxID=67381 RepID=UPI003796C933